MRLICKCGKPLSDILCPRCKIPTKKAHACERCMVHNRNRGKTGEYQKRGYCKPCLEIHQRERDAADKRKKRRLEREMDMEFMSKKKK